MQITIHYSAQARQAAGCASEAIALDQPLAVRDLLRLIAERHGALRPLVLTAQREPQPALLVFVNDAQVRSDSMQQLQDGETLTILPPIAGG